MPFEGMQVEVRLPYESGLPRDVSVNTFWFTGDGTGNVDDVFDNLEEFYNTPQLGSADSPSDYISAYVNRDTDACSMFAYLFPGVGPPLAVREWTLGGASSTNSLPFEVALCASYAGSTSGVAGRRQRGRIYLGPLTNTAMTTVAGNPSIPSTGVTVALGSAAWWLAQQSNPGDTWVVHSRAADAGYPIDHGWVDNEFDTQRRRQVEATDRYTWTA